MIKTTTLLLLFAYFTPVSVFGQLSSEYNRIRIGDNIVKQQVEYKDPGKSGRNVLWDFSKLKAINEEYTLSYSKPLLQGDSIYIMGDYVFKKKDIDDSNLIIATEHNTMYYYQIKNDSLFQLGHENSSVKFNYSRPIIVMPNLLNFDQLSKSEFESKGLYSGSEEITSMGEIKTQIDAYGKMILPSGDTLSSVLRVKSTQIFLDTKDSLTAKNGTESYRWYSKGYRYPVFETVRSINLADSTEIFTTAFLFPPQEHYYLDKDPKNMALLDSIWNENTVNQFSIRNQMTQDFTKPYKIYPNPVESLLNIEFKSSKNNEVGIVLYSSTGKICKKIDRKDLSTGYHTEMINCSDLPSGIYLIKITTGDQIICDKIIKK